MQLRKDCSKAVLPEDSLFEASDCRKFWGADRTAGMRLAWMSIYKMGVRDGDEGKAQTFEDLQAEGMCCGFGPPQDCTMVQSPAEFPAGSMFELVCWTKTCFETEFLDPDMLKQRYECSSVMGARRRLLLCPG